MASQAVIFVSLSSTLKSKELSPVIGHKAVQLSGATVPPVSGQQSNSQSPHSAEHSPHTLHKGPSHWDSSLIQSTNKILFKSGIIGWSDHCMHLVITSFSFCQGDFVTTCYCFFIVLWSLVHVNIGGLYYTFYNGMVILVSKILVLLQWLVLCWYAAAFQKNI